MGVWSRVTVTYLTIVMVSVTCIEHRIPGPTSKPRYDGSLVVKIKTQGWVRGSKAEDGDYNQFLGMRYRKASPRNRFETVLPVPTWKGIREANESQIACPQYSDFVGRVVGQEDCLVLNVYTPRRRHKRLPRKLLPVMVFFHGGGNEGSSERSVYGPRRFMKDNNVVLVTFNYRLSLLGFMCTGKIANIGLKDAVAVLEWIQSNIKAFGGDPSTVTIFGESWGGAMVEFLVLSKKTKGLFGGAICQSGLTSAPWAFGSDPEEKVRRVAKDLGYEGDDPEERLRVLKNAKVEDLITFTQNLVLMTPFELDPLSFCIEPASNPGAIITEDPRKAIQSGDFNVVPIMQGFNKDEAMVIYVIPDIVDMAGNDFVHTIPKDLKTHPAALRIADLAKNFYFGSKNITEETTPILVEYFTDTVYMLSSVQEARRYIRSSSKAPVYMYKFAYDGGLPYFKRLLNLTHIPGVSHADELGYLFTQDGVSSNRTDDETTAKRLVKLWTNFAKYRDPTPETSKLLPVKWTPVTEKDDYFSIGPNLEMKRKPFTARLEFWDSMEKQFPPFEA